MLIVALTGEDQESVAAESRYRSSNLLAIPVIVSGRQMLGIITHDRCGSIVVASSWTKDAQRIAAVALFWKANFLRIGVW